MVAADSAYSVELCRESFLQDLSPYGGSTYRMRLMYVLRIAKELSFAILEPIAGGLRQNLGVPDQERQRNPL